MEKYWSKAIAQPNEYIYPHSITSKGSGESFQLLKNNTVGIKKMFFKLHNCRKISLKAVGEESQNTQ